MGLGTATSQGSGGEQIVHVGGVRMRVIGSGNLDLELLSMDSIRSSVLTPLVLTPTTNREPTRLANFMDQRIALKVSMDELDEYFRINRIVVLIKPVFTEYPM
jgi:hypothetical protein